ncbi:hypothetical protein L2E82_26760 [Cichorium intybus]|uniref:Uncharacterized protein n=1 Tax=Cichorium intybus TaxID=13427 RepID=A0ACB9CRH0_CICIN|nr:hypothetical protein L2E82_26760 [Cichorium intybus]
MFSTFGVSFFVLYIHPRPHESKRLLSVIKTRVNMLNCNLHVFSPSKGKFESKKDWMVERTTLIGCNVMLIFDICHHFLLIVIDEYL